MKRVLTYLAIGAAVLSSCSKSGVSDEFLESDSVSLEVGGKTVLAYEPLTCQYAYNAGKKQFRLSDDSFSSYYVLELSKPINGKMKEIECNLEWNTDKSSGSGTYTFKIEKFDGEGRWWLSNKKKKIGVSFIIPK